MSCTRRKTRGIWSLICLVLAMFLLFRHAARKQPSSIKEFRRRVSKIDVEMM